jgi:hypothetical protein
MTQLSDTVLSTLTDNGTVAKIKAELRASIYSLLAQTTPEKLEAPPSILSKRKILQSEDGID